MSRLTRKEIENYFISACGINPVDFAEYSKSELEDILELNGELGLCLDYNGK